MAGQFPKPKKGDKPKRIQGGGTSRIPRPRANESKADFRKRLKDVTGSQITAAEARRLAQTTDGHQ